MYHPNSIKKLAYLSFILATFLTISNCKNENVKSSKTKIVSKTEVPEGMIWIEGKTFLQGAKKSDKYA